MARKIIHKDMLAYLETLTDYELSDTKLGARMTEKYGCDDRAYRRLRKSVRDKRELGKKDGIAQASANTGIPIQNLKHGWRKVDTDSGYYTNPHYDPDNIQDFISAFERVIEKYKTKVFKNKPRIKTKSNRLITVTTTDEHVGLDPNPNGNGIFGYEYTPEIYKKRYDEIFDVICQKRELYQEPFELLCLDNLGDEQDGWHGYTTRGGHKLSQNASNLEVAEAVMDAKIELIHKCVDNQIAKKFILRKVGNDNHSGDFGKIVNLGIKKAIEATYKSDLVFIDILHKFIEQREWGIHKFLMTHGKDEKEMKHGLPFYLTPIAKNWIRSYMEHYGLNREGILVHLDKGDLHRYGVEKTRNFNYTNFMSFAPPSNYVQTNYPDDATAGFTCRVFHKEDTQEDITNIIFDYKKVKP